MRAFDHHVEDALDVRRRDVFVEKIAHRVDEDKARSLPAFGHAEKVRMKRDGEPVTVAIASHGE
ncbi:hypothetical protein D3C83_168160 [compost metagenome]